MSYENKYQEFEQYLCSSEPDKVQRAKNWSIAIGLQQVDGLTPSDFLVSQAKENIEGRISTENVRHRLEEYHQRRDVLEKAETDRILEADGVSERINALLAQKAFTFSPMELVHIHGYIFKGVLSHAGLFSTSSVGFTAHLSYLNAS